MKFCAILLGVIFISFLSTPTIVSLIEKNKDVSICFSSSEEESQNNNNDLKEIKSNFNFNFDFNFSVSTVLYKQLIFSKNVSKIDNLSKRVFSPPPEFI